MKPIIPEPRMILAERGGGLRIKQIAFDWFRCAASVLSPDIEDVVESKFSPVSGLMVSGLEKTAKSVSRDLPKTTLRVDVHSGIPDQFLEKVREPDLFNREGYVLDIRPDGADLFCSRREGFLNGISTLKSLLEPVEEGMYGLPMVTLLDYPLLSVRSISTTFAWYAGYGRIGFDMQLWGEDEWKSFIIQCSDFKINQVNLCLYGYWPFSFPEYPETELRDFPLRVWNPESRNWIQINYSHPNISRPFLGELIHFAHSLGMSIFAYIGLNSYNGGFSNVHRDKRMVFPPESRFINDFDSLCLGLPENLDYLKAMARKMTSLGFDGIIFEESEESFWFCHCESCKKRFVDPTPTPAEAKHQANYWLLSQLEPEIKRVNPHCQIGLRAWREPPLNKERAYLEQCKSSLSPDIVLYWAPGLYVDESEFVKWVDVFGAERVCARDTESNAWSSTQGRLFRMFKKNVLRGEQEANDQFIEKDIEQHQGSVKQGVRGINGYLFEWYGYFLHLFAHAQYGWGSSRPAEDFYRHALSAVFGAELVPDILYILENLFTIHESQVKIFQIDFPFLKNKVGEADVPAIRQALERSGIIEEKLGRVIEQIEKSDHLRLYLPHFEKLANCLYRNREIYHLCLASIRFDSATDSTQRRKWLLQMDYYNERDFALVKRHYFDINPVDATGVKACMYPHHELKRLIFNELDTDRYDPDPVYLGVEALGWFWIDKKY